MYVNFTNDTSSRQKYNLKIIKITYISNCFKLDSESIYEILCSTKSKQVKNEICIKKNV